MKHRKITKSRRRMFSLAAGMALAATGTAGVASAASGHHADAATPVHQADAATPVHPTDARDFAEAVGGQNREEAARPISELSAAERANAVG
ncbi:hypothetical protein [Streptomyces hirsutus]|uniref:hypothetical protein n=1 Tax=Streptomyces hirsutus TaxID=35620 RepID=UPI0036CFC4CA